MTKIFAFILIGITITLFGQDQKVYDSVYNKTYLEKAQKDFLSSLKTADSLFTISKTPELQAKSLLLSANLYVQVGNVEKSVALAQKAENIVAGTDLYFVKCRICGFLATQYRILKLFKQSEQYFKKCVETSDNIIDVEKKNNVKGLIYQERSYMGMALGHYKDAIRDANISQKYFRKIKNPQPFHLVNNLYLFGQNYYLLKNYNMAEKHFNNALNISKNLPDNYLKGLVYNGLALVSIDKKEMKNAGIFLEGAKLISDKSEYLDLKKEITKTSAKYYYLKNDLKNFTKTVKTQDSVVQKLETQKISFMDKSFQQLSKENITEKHNINTKNKIVWISIFALIIISCYVLIIKRQHKKNIESFRKLMVKVTEQNASNKELNDTLNIENPVIIDNSDCSETRKMVDSTETKILCKLERFEKSTLFTKNTITLSSLSTYCETNTKYLSLIINNHKEKDFNNYINELRIKYVIEKLKEDAKYRKYKISVLAEEAGFSSPNKFATIFKNSTGISPSVFIKYLDEEVVGIND